MFAWLRRTNTNAAETPTDQALRDANPIPPPYETSYVIAPGHVLKEMMGEYRIDTHETAGMTSIGETDIIGILHGTLPVTEPIARRLEHTFGPSAAFWLALEQRYRDGKSQGKADLP